MVPFGSDAPHNVVERVGDVEVARGVGRHTLRGIQLRVDGGAAIAGEAEHAVAGDGGDIAAGEFADAVIPSESAKYMLPEPSSATAVGPFISTLLAGPPSPAKPRLPSPMAVVILPLVSTLRMRFVPNSAM